MTTNQSQQALKVYWQPGCSSCLKTKEFLLANGMEFESINVLEDEKGFRELEALGVRLVPIVARGSDWANGAVFRDVARVAGFEWAGHTMLEPGQIPAATRRPCHGVPPLPRSPHPLNTPGFPW